MLNSALLLTNGSSNELKAGMKITGLNYVTEVGGNIVLGTGGVGSQCGTASWKANSSDNNGGIQLISSSGSGASFLPIYATSTGTVSSWSTSEKDYIASAKVSKATLTEIQITNPGKGYKDVKFKLNMADYYLPDNSTYLDGYGKYTYTTKTIALKK